MSTHQRKRAETREQELRLAIVRIERGRSRANAVKLSVSAVAREAGVTPALIHNHYPSIAEAIRVKLGASSRQQRDAKQSELKQILEKNRALRQELSETEGRLAKLASINEMLLLENKTLKAMADSSKVVNLNSKRT
ncbi:TetR family transcriptional regulator [Variovorax paradoxus]|uniref:TetR family transcriptional regulator n=1 Tax=Variovorax paradoxus TaxID=34073 RepID=UPI00285D0B7E|nr:TetR family transcriptional regulator [Variovorax paradoxus]MDR6453468.1 AcrR family transcriptional regulator [Variovorax paradoxus]